MQMPQGKPEMNSPVQLNFRGHRQDDCGRRGGLMVSALDSGASGPGSSPGRGHCVVFLGKTLHCHSASLHPGYKWVPANLMLGVTLRWTSIPSRGE